jgi:peptidyl-prolyl cis-trans isomerase D
MQIIQTIRDKGAAIIIGVIAVSLLGFLLMDANSGRSGFFKSLSSNVGKVNGSGIEKAEFDKKFTQSYDMAKEQSQSQGGQVPSTDQIREQVWDGMVAQKLFYDEADKLGIAFTSKELSAILNSMDPNNPLLREKAILDDNGQPDPAKLTAAINNIKKAKGDDYERLYASIVEPQRISSVSGKYLSLLNASAYYPGWMKEKDSAEAKSFANISYTFVSYGEISDSTIKVSDNEIEAYVAKHKDQFKQEAGRLISYVAFSQQPGAQDSAAVKAQLETLKSSFAAETNMASFVARNSTSAQYDSTYKKKSQIPSSSVDSIAKMPIGSVYGPYIDNGSYVLAKYLGSRSYADSAKARHILIGVTDPQNGQLIMPDSTAKKLADSLLRVINAGGNFTALAKQFSTDGGSKENGGLYESFAYGQMVPEFNDFAFTKPAGTRGIVKTSFGYHIMEAMGTKGNSPAYRIAFVTKDILPSDSTMNASNNNAATLAAQKSSKDFDAYVAKNGLQKVSWPSIVKENDYKLGAFQDARQLIKWAFEAKKGDISTNFNIEGQFVVATVDKVTDEGVQDAAAARAGVEGIVRNKKKADIIIKKLGANPTVEAAAAAYNKQVQTAGADSSIVFNGRIIPGIGDEPKILGASFNKEYQSKPTPPMAGNMGVYVIKVNSIGTKDGFVPSAMQRLTALKAQVTAGWFEGLKNQATIKDNRSEFY